MIERYEIDTLLPGILVCSSTGESEVGPFQKHTEFTALDVWAFLRPIGWQDIARSLVADMSSRVDNIKARVDAKDNIGVG